MRGKRSKQYRKLMQQYKLLFGFREPYQVLVDAEMLHDTHRFAMDLVPALTRTLHGEVKVQISSCSIRHLYALPTSSSAAPAAVAAADADIDVDTSVVPGTALQPVTPATKTALITLARTLELRRCGHHTLPAPLSAAECIASVLDPGGGGVNRHRLVLAAQDVATRTAARRVLRALPVVYVRRSVMILEPMDEATRAAHAGWERGKLLGDATARHGLARVDAVPQKRKAEEDAAKDEDEDEEEVDGEGGAEDVPPSKPKRPMKKRKGPKAPNPLSRKKKVKKPGPGLKGRKAASAVNS